MIELHFDDEFGLNRLPLHGVLRAFPVNLVGALANILVWREVTYF